MIHIRRAALGDEKILAYVQTESWKAAFGGIIPADLLTECTKLARIEAMYERLLASNKGQGYILELDGSPHCIAWWDTAREKVMTGFAELICIHSLKSNWHKGCGTKMMRQIMEDAKSAGYSSIMLWVFQENARAIDFYKANGFAPSGRTQQAFGATEEMYLRAL